MKFYRNLATFALSVISLTAFSQEMRRVLFLGNSYTYVNDLPHIVAELAANTGDVLIYDGNLIGSYTLEDHFADTVSKNKILLGGWDYVVLQEQSQRPAFPVPFAFMNGFSNLRSFINQNDPCAIITSFMTWGYENGDSQNCPNNPNVCTYVGMANLIKDRYIAMSDLYESEVTPVGAVWDYIRTNYPGINLYHPDGSHPSVAGSYLAACCFYTSLFRKNPALITNDYGLDPNVAATIRNAAKTLVFDQMMSWYIGKYVPNSNFTFKIGNGTNEVIMSSNTSVYWDSFVWDFGDGTTSTALLPTHNYATDGNFTIKLTSNNCFLGQNHVSVFERNVNFCAHTNTIFPNLFLCPNTTGTVWTQPADSYQWCDFFGNPIAGATNQSLEVLPGHSYSVLTTIDGCTENSPQILVDTPFDINDECDLSIIDIDKKLEVKIYPNPSKNSLQINTSKPIKSVEIINELGQTLQFIDHYISDATINTMQLSGGIYCIKITDFNDQTITRKFIQN